MTHAFELFIQRGNPKELDWDNLLNTLFDYGHEFDIEILFEGAVSFHVFADKDLSPMGSKVLPFIVKKEDRQPFNAKQLSKKKMLFMRLHSDKTILEIKERQKIKYGRELKRVIWHVVRYLHVRASTMELYFEDKNGNLVVVKRVFPEIPVHLLQGIDWTSAVKYKTKEVPIYLKLDKDFQLFSEQNRNALVEVDGFPYFTKKEFFGLDNYEFNKHTLIVGTTGVGKSKFISLFVKKVVEMGLDKEYAVVVIDPHASLFADFAMIPNSINIDFRGNACDLFFKNAEPKIGTELTIMLFKTLLKEQFNGKMEQVLKYSIFALMASGKMGIFQLKSFLTEMPFRNEVLAAMQGQDNIKKFFDTEFVEITTKYYDAAVMPVLTLIDELNFLPVFSQETSLSMEKSMQDNFLTCVSLSRIFLGDRATKLIAGLIIQQIFLIAQSWGHKKKILFIIDEVPVVENDALITILAEARKFDLSLFLSMQYLMQASGDLLKGMLSNMYNYFVFKATEEDARLLERNLSIDIPDEVIRSWESLGETKEELQLKSITQLGVRECLVRAYLKGQFYPCFKSKTVDVT